MPETFLTNHAPGFLKVYDEFYKQVQYKMTAFQKCEDPNNKDPFGFDVQYPTDTYYPRGMFAVTCHIILQIIFTRNNVCKTFLSSFLLLFW